MAILYCAKEAGGGALLASMIDADGCSQNSIIVGGDSALPYFSNLDIQAFSDQISEDHLEEILLKINPEKIITVAATGHSIDKRIFLLSKKHRIPIHSYVDHYWNIWQRFADPKTKEKWAFTPDRIFLPDRRCIDRAIKYGADKTILSSYTHPLLIPRKSIKSSSTELESSLKEKYGIPSDAVVALFISETFFLDDPDWDWDQATKEDLEFMLGLLLDVSEKYSEGKKVVILVRPHPSESPNAWDSICNSRHGACWINASQISKDELFSISSLAFGNNSMLLLEMANAGVPAYSHHKINVNNEMWLSSIRSEIIEINNPEMIYGIINCLLNEKRMLKN